MKAKSTRKTTKKPEGQSAAEAAADHDVAAAARLRVHHLARELGATSKDILERCHSRGVELKNHMAILTTELASQIRSWFGGTSGASPPASESPAGPATSSRFRPEPPSAKIAGPQVEAADDALTIRFPPAAPPPFAPVEPRAAAPVTRAEPMDFAARRAAARAEASGGAAPQPTPDASPGQGAERRGRDRGRGRGGERESPRPTESEAVPAERTERRRDDAGQGRRAEGRGRGTAPAERGAAPTERGATSAERGSAQNERGRPAADRATPNTGRAAPEAGDDLLTAEERKRLSPSQKRRLRRRRRRERDQAEGGTGAAPRSAPSPAATGRELELDEEDELESALPPAPRHLRDEARSFIVDDEDGNDGENGEVLNAVVEPDVEVEEAPEQLYAAEEAADLLVEIGELEPDASVEKDTAEPESERGEGRGRRGRRGRGRERDRERRGRYSDREQPTLAADISPEGRGVSETSGPPTREMIINVVPREECRIAILHEGKLEEIYLERASSENYVSNIYKGVVTNVEPSIQAAFVDFGMGKNGFLHISDLHPEYFPNNEGHHETVGRKTPRKHRPPIQKCLRRGQELIVQVNKEGIGTKGPTLSTYLSIPGRFLVMMPGMKQLGVSRRIENEDQRRQLRGLLSQLELPEDMGFIARTAAVGRTVAELQGDLNYLARLWRAVEQRRKHERAPCELYRESDLVIRTIRDVFTNDIRKILVDDADVAERARDFLSIFNPSYGDIVVEYKEPQPIFHRYGIEAELERLHSRHVPLPSGGSLVIDQTEALVAIDVNSGKYRTEDDAETTAYKIDLEAANEIPRQLRLRDLGGVIICDFIDVRMESHRREIERRLIENLRKHKERCKVLRMSAFGIVEMTRQRQRASLQRSVYRDCHFCRGTGLVKTAESVALDVMRLIQLAMTREAIHTIEVLVSPEVAYLIQNRKRRLLSELEGQHRRVILIRAEQGYGLDQVEVRCSDARGRVLPHA